MNRKAKIAVAVALTGLVSLSASAAPPPGRLLASNCFQCHDTNGNGGFERLAGMSANEIVNELREMRAKATPGIMEVHARGYTDAQLQLIGNYFAGLTRTSSTTATGTVSPTSSTRERHDD